MSEVVLENVPIKVDSSPSRRENGQHWVNKSVEDIADEYFASIDPFAQKIILEKHKCKKHQRDWDQIDHRERDNLLDDWFIDASIKLKYELKLGIITPKQPGVGSFPRRVVQGGTKTVQYREEDHDGGNGTGKYSQWKDEFSGPFSWETKCQQDLSIFSGESSSSSTPRHEATKSESLLDPSKSMDESLLRSLKTTGDEDASSVMVMKDVTKRRSFGNNLLASLEERLAFDQVVSDTNDKKRDDKVFQHIGQIGNRHIHAGESENNSSPSTPQESRRKTSENSYKKKVSKPKMAPPGPGPKPRDIPKYNDPPMYHKSQSLPQSNLPKYAEPPRYAPDVEPPTQTMDRGRPTVEPPKQRKVSKPKMEPPKPKVEKPKVQPPKVEPPKPKVEKPKVQPPKMEPPKPKVERPKVQPPPPKQPEKTKVQLPPPKQQNRPTMAPPEPARPIMVPPEPTRQMSEKSAGSVSPRRQMSPRGVDREKLLPQTQTPSAAAKEGIPTSSSHDNLSLENDDGDNAKAPAEAGDGGFDFLTAW